MESGNSIPQIKLFNLAPAFVMQESIFNVLMQAYACMAPFVERCVYIFLV